MGGSPEEHGPDDSDILEFRDPSAHKIGRSAEGVSVDPEEIDELGKVALDRFGQNRGRLTSTGGKLDSVDSAQANDKPRSFSVPSPLPEDIDTIARVTAQRVGGSGALKDIDLPDEPLADRNTIPITQLSIGIPVVPSTLQPHQALFADHLASVAMDRVTRNVAAYQVDHTVSELGFLAATGHSAG